MPARGHVCGSRSIECDEESGCDGSWSHPKEADKGTGSLPETETCAVVVSLSPVPRLVTHRSPAVP